MTVTKQHTSTQIGGTMRDGQYTSGKREPVSPEYVSPTETTVSIVSSVCY